MVIANQQATPAAGQSSNSTAQVVQAMMSFARLVWYHKIIVIAAVLVSSLLGGLYYGTATRYYQSSATLMILQTGSDMAHTGMSSKESRKGGLMPTYQRLITSDAVLGPAAAMLKPWQRNDFDGGDQDQWGAKLRKNLTASIVRNTNIIEVTYRSKNPETAAAVVDAVVKSYLEYMDRTHKGTAREINEIFTTEMQQREIRLAEKRKQLTTAKRKYKDLLNGKTDVRHPVVDTAFKFHEALVETQKKRVELQSSLAAIDIAVRNGHDLQQHILSIENVVGRTYLAAQLGIGDTDSGLRASMEQKLVDLESKLTTLDRFYGSRDPRVIEVQDNIRSIRRYLAEYQQQMKRKLDKIRREELGPLLLEMVKQKLSETNQREEIQQSQYDQALEKAEVVSEGLGYIAILERDVTWQYKLREKLLDRIGNVDLSKQQGSIRAAKIDEAKVSPVPVWPRLTMVGLMAVFVGLAVGVGAVYVIDILDDRFRSPEDLKEQVGSPVLAMIRQLSTSDRVGIDAVQVHHSPDGTDSEAFRTLRTTLAFASQNANRIVVTSSEPGDGKTTVLINLAVAYAHAGKRTLVIDADLRRPGLTAMLKYKGVTGLSDVLRNRENFEQLAAESIQATVIDGLDVLPAGLRRSNPGEMLGSEAFIDLLAWAESIYDQILLDSPPTLAASDTSIIGKAVDGVVMVVQPRKNKRHMVMRAAESLKSIDIPLLGLVVNRVDEMASSGYQAYGYGYGYEYSSSANDEPNVVKAQLTEDEQLEVETLPPVFPPTGRRDDTQGTNQKETSGIVPRRVA